MSRGQLQTRSTFQSWTRNSKVSWPLLRSTSPQRQSTPTLTGTRTLRKSSTTVVRRKRRGGKQVCMEATPYNNSSASPWRDRAERRAHDPFDRVRCTSTFEKGSRVETKRDNRCLLAGFRIVEPGRAKREILANLQKSQNDM